MGQLARALDLAVACEYLLEQGRSRARQPEYEDRRWVRQSATRARLKEIAVEYSHKTIVHRFGLNLVIRDRRSLLRVSLLVVGPCVIELHAIFVGLAQGEQKVHLGLNSQAARACA